MTLQEFLLKKKIHEASFCIGRKELYEQFVLEYVLMGEKSFDHTKKYWFNKLRREFPIPQSPSTEATEK